MDVLGEPQERAAVGLLNAQQVGARTQTPCCRRAGRVHDPAVGQRELGRLELIQ